MAKKTTAATKTKDEVKVEEVKTDEAPDESATEAEPEKQDEAPDESATEAEPEPITKDTPCPFEATVSVALAVLRKNAGVGTAEMLKPVATLKQGTKVTVTAVRDEGCLIRNGLWIATEYLTK